MYIQTVSVLHVQSSAFREIPAREISSHTVSSCMYPLATVMKGIKYYKIELVYKTFYEILKIPDHHLENENLPCKNHEDLNSISSLRYIFTFHFREIPAREKSSCTDLRAAAMTL